MKDLLNVAKAFQPDILLSVYYRKILPDEILNLAPKVRRCGCTIPAVLPLSSASPVRI